MAYKINTILAAREKIRRFRALAERAWVRFQGTVQRHLDPSQCCTALTCGSLKHECTLELKEPPDPVSNHSICKSDFCLYGFADSGHFL